MVTPRTCVGFYPRQDLDFENVSALRISTAPVAHLVTEGDVTMNGVHLLLTTLATVSTTSPMIAVIRSAKVLVSFLGFISLLSF